jgi:hypothetical protein
MKVVCARQHPNADALRVYDFQGTSDATLPVVANLDHVYEVGDVVAVAKLGAVLKDETKIHKITLRGIGSYGMAMGKVDVPVGTDLTAEYCHPEYTPSLSARHVTWPSIELLHNVRRSMDKRREYLGRDFIPPSVVYRAKVKLHGINGAVQVVNGEVVAQSRTAILKEGGDLTNRTVKSFYRWVTENSEHFAEMELPGKHLTIYGEWCGPGVQRGVGISKLDRKIFAVFGAQIGVDQDAALEVRPEVLKQLVPDHPDVYVLPWYGASERLDFGLGASMDEPVSRMNEMVKLVEKEDPWVRAIFGISGMGEGLVWYPEPETPLPWYCPYAEMMFKTKGEKHSVVKQKAPVVIDPEVVASIEAFAEKFVTENRLQQIFSETFGDAAPTKRDTGTFMKALQADVLKESKAELEAAKLTWKQVVKAVTTNAKNWFFAHIEEGN